MGQAYYHDPRRTKLYTDRSTMADHERDMDETNEALDPELLYSKEYCIG